MNEPAAFRGTYSDWRLVKTRAVVQIIFEVPLADSDAAYEILGGMPVHGKERWFGIAALKSTAEEAPSNVPSGSPPSTRPDGTKRPWRDLLPAQQAGIRCDEPSFAAFLREERKDDWAEDPDPVDCVYLICGIRSRSELNHNQKSRVIWHQLDSAYQAWLAKERVGA
jgi:hypothetical protein